MAPAPCEVTTHVPLCVTAVGGSWLQIWSCQTVDVGVQMGGLSTTHEQAVHA
jgi:hypothetical protein